MRLITYQSPTGPRVAGSRDGTFVDLNLADRNIPHCITTLLAQGPAGLRRTAEALRDRQAHPRGGTEAVADYPESGEDHVRGAKLRRPRPRKRPDAPGRTRVLQQVPRHYSLRGAADRLAAGQQRGRLRGRTRRRHRHRRAIHRRGSALEHVAGYCCGNDVSARDWQLRKPGGQWLLGKSFDSFAPVGPTLVTADEIPDPGHLAIQLRLNGQVMQRSNTAELIFSVAKLIAYVSQVCTLALGDVLFTGTPAGVGCTRKPPVFLKPGDTVEVEIERIGVLRNPVVGE